MIINDFLKQVPIVKDMTSAYNAYNLGKTAINKMAALPPVQESPINTTTVNSTAQAFLPPSSQGYTPTPTVGVSTPVQDYNTSASKWAGSSIGAYKPPVSTGTPTPTSAGDAMITVYKNGQPREVRQSQLAGFLGSGFTTTAPTQPVQPTSIPGAVPGQPNPTNPIQPTSTTPPVAPEQPTTQVNPTNGVYNKYGLKAPVAPTLNHQQDIMGQYKLTPEQIQANLDATKVAIQQKYNLQRQEAERISENEKQSSLSSLYSTGEVNPLSSGVSNIAEDSDRNRNSRLDALNQMQAQEEREAEMKAYNENYKAAGMKNDLYAQENKRIEDQYQLNRTQLDDTISLIDFGRKVTKEDTENAKNSFADLLAQGGSQAFEGYGTEQLSSLDKASGQPQGTYANILKKIKMDELKGQSEIERLNDGSVVSWKQDEKGNWTHETLIKAPVGTAEAPKVQNFGDAGYMQWNPQTNSWDTVPGTEDTEDTVPMTLEQTSTATEVRDLANEILNDRALTATTGPVGQYIPSWKTLTGKTSDLSKKITRLKSLLTLDNMGKMKGVLSDSDIKILTTAATTLDKGQTTGAIEEELSRIIETVGRKLGDTVGGGEYNQDEVNYLMEQYGMNEEEAAQQLGFQQPLSRGDENKGLTTFKLGKKEVKVSNQITDKLAKADSEFFKAFGEHIDINQSFRTYEQQAELYRKSQAGEIGRAAPPGKSFHETGNAIDVTNWKKAAPFLNKYGLVNPMSDDKGHFSFGEFT